MVILPVLLVCCEVFAFQPPLRNEQSHFSLMAATKSSLFDAPTTRRSILAGAGWAAATTFLPKPSEAKYSTYQRREADWEARLASGDVEYGTARSLRQQMRELVPQNSNKSLKFCPNGVTAAVSPLMENKCGDWLAEPSIFGRTEDVAHNSIPGFREGYKHTTVAKQDTERISDRVGFPAYGPDPRLVMFRN